ncbi:MAG: flagellar basal body-associated FliL family protein [Brevinematales bacterium]|jgi:flagellar FliL protein
MRLEIKQKKNAKGLIYFAISIVFLLIIGLVVAGPAALSYFLIYSAKSKSQEDIYRSAALVPKPGPYSVFEMDDFRMRTADKIKPHFLKVRLSLAYDGTNKILGQELTQRSSQLREVIMSILKSKTKRDLVPEAAKEGLKKEFEKEINEMLKTGAITDIYYDEFIIL